MNLATILLVTFAQSTPEPAWNAPVNCPYCHGTERFMKSSGIVSHGGFILGNATTAKVDAIFPEAKYVWVETEHFELGLGTPPGDRKPPYRLHRMICDEALPSLSKIPFNRSFRTTIQDVVKHVLPWQVQNAYRVARWRRAGLETCLLYKNKDHNSFPWC